MSKVKKKKISKKPVNKNQEDDITKIQNKLKNSIKNLYLNDQKKKKENNRRICATYYKN